MPSRSPLLGFFVSILALDLGTQTGWAISGSPIISGTVSFKPGRYSGGGERFLRFQRWLAEVCSGEVKQIVFEEVRRHAATDAAHVYGGLLGVLSAFCEEHSIPYQGVPVGTIKKCLTGKGNASKADMIAAVQQRGYKPTDDNEADAIAILLWALSNET